MRTQAIKLYARDFFFENVVSELPWTATIKSKQTECSVFPAWIAKDKLKYRELSVVHWMFGSGDITFSHRMLNRVKAIESCEIF